MGFKDGVLLAGFLSPEALDAAPELSDRMKALYGDDKLQGSFILTRKLVRDTILSLLDPEGPWAAFISEDRTWSRGSPTSSKA